MSLPLKGMLEGHYLNMPTYMIHSYLLFEPFFLFFCLWTAYWYSY